MSKASRVGRLGYALPLLLIFSLVSGCGGDQPNPASTPANVTPTDLGTLLGTPNPTSAATPTVLIAATSIQDPTSTPTKRPAQTTARYADFIVTVAGTATPTRTATIPVPTATPTRTAGLAERGSLAQQEVPAATCSYGAAFVADVTVPDDSVLNPGEPFVKIWLLRNSGSCDWDGGLRLSFSHGELMGAQESVVIPSTEAGDSLEVSVALTAPLGFGTYSGHWELQTPDGQVFGDPFYVRITVPSTTSTEPTPSPRLTLLPPSSPVPRLVLFNYFAWYDLAGWDACNISAGDRPLQPYHSDNPSAIARHVQMAVDAGVDGFTLQWFAPGDRTDRNFETLLAQSQGTGLRSTMVFLRHIWHGDAAGQPEVVAALRYILERYGGHPNFLTVEGRPVIFITDVYRVPLATGQTPQQAWGAIRAQVDPDGRAWWIAEGLDPSYLAVFDGLWVYKITHATSPAAYLRANQWADSVHRWETQTGKRKLWIGTVSPGWDDLRAGCKADVRASSPAHKQERLDGAFFRATFDAALASQPDWLWVNSFNEWVEGTYVEPSVNYGDQYLRMTGEFADAFRNR
jgi:hypothetical protein